MAEAGASAGPWAGLWKAISQSRVAYAAVSSAVSPAETRTIQPAAAGTAEAGPRPLVIASPVAACSAAVSTASLLKKPANGGSPTRATSAMPIVQ